MGRERAAGEQDHGQVGGVRGPASTWSWGQALRRAREARGWTQVELGREMDYDPSVISKLENGQTNANEQHARAADRALGLPGLFASWLEDVVNGTGGPYQRDIAELEERARVLSVWEPTFIPGLFQTEEYMRAVYLAAEPEASDGQIEQMVAARLGRQEIRGRADPLPPLLYTVIWEPALRLPIGGPEVMHDQLKLLADAARQDRRVRVQILPAGGGANPGMAGSFTLASYADERSAAYLDNILFGQITERRLEVARLAILFATLAADALDTRASAELIEKVAGEWKP